MWPWIDMQKESKQRINKIIEKQLEGEKKPRGIAFVIMRSVYGVRPLGKKEDGDMVFKKFMVIDGGCPSPSSRESGECCRSLALAEHLPLGDELVPLVAVAEKGTRVLPRPLAAVDR